ncbi:MAG: PaaI family thioesterase [Oscillospiraceae bacterium]|nr:PaaI family thioesterase [Oscillospiraceae bacterium]
MLLEIQEVRENGISVQGNPYEEFNNIYGIAHGGYLYTVAYIAAQMTGDLCLGGKWDVRNAECIYLHPLRLYPSHIDTVWIHRDEQYPLLRAEVRDNRGTVCFELNAVLAPAEPEPEQAVTHTPTIITDRRLPKSPYEKPQFPCLSSTFSRWLDIYSTSMTDEIIVYSADLTERNCVESGYLHPAVMFTAADCAAGGCLFYIDKKRPITVSANIHYLKRTFCGPVHAVSRPVRKGRILNFFDVDLIDGNGVCVATAQFVIQHLDHNS